MSGLPLFTYRTVLLGAAQALRRRGWCQQARVDSAGRVCAVGALHASMNLTFKDPIMWQALRAIERVIGRPDLACWNDQPGRTAEEVIEVFQQAAMS